MKSSLFEKIEDMVGLDIEEIIRIIIVLIAGIIITVGIVKVFRYSMMQPEYEEPVDARFTPAYVGIETTYDYVYDIGSEGYRKMPNTHSVYYPDKYEILYHRYFNSDKHPDDEVWREVTKNEYYEVTGIPEEGEK